MQGARVIGDERAAVRQEARERGYVGLSDEVDQRSAAPGGVHHLRGRRAVAGGADENCRDMFVREPRREIRKRVRRPSLRRTEGGARRKRDDRRTPVPARLAQRAGTCLAKRRGGIDARRRRTVGEAERGNELLVVRDLMQARWRAPDRAREKDAPPVRRVAPAFRHAGSLRGQRRLKRVRQQERGLAAREDRRPIIGQGDDLVDVGRQREQRRDRGSRGHGNRGIRTGPAHVRDGRQRHHRIAQPVGRNDHEAFHSDLIVSMKIALLQINPTVGDLTGNARLIAEAAEVARRSDCGLAVTPELALAGYLPRDLLLSPGFVSRCWTTLAALAETLRDGPPVLVGLPEANESAEGRPLYNAAVLLRGGQIGPRFRKGLLPTYDVFDEDRYFEPFRGPQVLTIGNRRLASASAKTCGTIATSGSGGVTTSIRLRNSSPREPMPW